jgi:hypothetical protein
VQTACRWGTKVGESIPQTGAGEQSRAASSDNVLKRLVNAMSSAPQWAEKATTYCCCLRCPRCGFRCVASLGHVAFRDEGARSALVPNVQRFPSSTALI